MSKTIKKLKKLDLLETREAYVKVLHWFFSYPDREMSLNDISSEVEISKTTAKKIVEDLIDEGFLERNILGKTWRISCNKNHPYNHTRKVCYNLNMIFESAILKAVYDIIKNPKAVVLFGSYRKGDDTEKSDIDIAVEVFGDEDVRIVELGILPEFGHRKKVLVNLYIFSRNKADLNLFANIANGIVLSGFLEARP